MCFRPEKTVSVEKHHAKLEEGGVKLDLTVVRISTPVLFFTDLCRFTQIL